jgi:acetyl-CoA C-acetyltransferase
MGLLYGNGGIVTTQHAIVLSGARPDRPFTPLTPDVQTFADQRMGASPDVIEDYTGPAEVETWTVRYDREGAASRAVIVARTATGARSLAEVPVREAPVIAMLTDGAICPIGMTGQIETAEGIRRFVFD